MKEKVYIFGYDNYKYLIVIIMAAILLSSPRIEAASTPVQTSRGSQPSITQKEEESARLERQAKTILEEQKQILGIGPDLSYRLERRILWSEDSQAKLGHAYYSQLYKDIPVDPSRIVLHLDDAGKLTHLSGNLHVINALDTTPHLPKEEATAIAQSNVMHNSRDGIVIHHTKEAELMVYAERVEIPRKRGKVKLEKSYHYYLAWKIMVYGERENAPLAQEVIIEASTGRVLAQIDHVVHEQHEQIDQVVHETETRAATGNATYSGAVNFYTSYENPGYVMRDGDRANEIFLIDENDIWNPFYDPDNAWIAVDQADVSEAMYNVKRIYEYYKDHLGRNGYDAAHGIVSTGLLMDGTNNAFAQYDDDDLEGKDARVWIGNGNGDDHTFFGTLEIIGHEYAHLLFAYENEVTGGEKDLRAVNESLADTFSVLAGYYHTGQADWLMGDQQSTIGKPFRYINDPEAGGQPEHMSNYFPDEPYQNMGITSYAFYLFAQGGINETSQISTTPIGLERAEAIYYYALTHGYLDSSADFWDFKTMLQDALVDLTIAEGTLDLTGTEQDALDRAFDAVGISEEPTFWIYPHFIHPTQWVVLGPGDQATGKVTIESIDGFSGQLNLSPTISPSFPGTVTLDQTSVTLKPGQTTEIGITLTAHSNVSANYTEYTFSLLGKADDSSTMYNLHDVPLLVTTNPMGLDLEPNSGKVGDVLTITGVNLSRGGKVQFKGETENAVYAAFSPDPEDPSHIAYVTVPDGIRDGKVYLNGRGMADGEGGYAWFDFIRPGKVIEVGPNRQYSTIDDALDIADDGDTLLVDPGIYRDHVTIDGFSSLSIVSAEGTEETILEGDGSNLPIMWLYNSSNIKVSGFTFRDNSSDMFGSALTSQDSNVEIADNIFKNISTYLPTGSVISIGEGNGDPTSIHHCLFMENRDAMIIFAAPDSSPIFIDHNRFEENVFEGGPLLSLYGTVPDARLSNNVFYSNQALAAIDVNGWSGSGLHVVISNNTFAKHDAINTGWVIYSQHIETSDYIDISNNIIAYTQNGSAVSNSDVDGVTVTHNLFFENAQGNEDCTSGDPRDFSFNFCGDPQFVEISSGDLKLLSTSPAVDTADDSKCPTSDFLDLRRPQGNHCDIGAYEWVSNSYTINTDLQLEEIDFDQDETNSQTLEEKNLDQDDDGYSLSRDCNDKNDTVHIGATEICNGIDDDCDGQIDEDTPYLTYYEDGDEDGYGSTDPNLSITLCPLSDETLKASHLSKTNDDCNDKSSTIHPGAIEKCDGKDNNCMDGIDENNVCPTEPTSDPDTEEDEVPTDTDGDGVPQPEESEPDEPENPTNTDQDDDGDSTPNNPDSDTQIPDTEPSDPQASAPDSEFPDTQVSDTESVDPESPNTEFSDNTNPETSPEASDTENEEDSTVEQSTDEGVATEAAPEQETSPVEQIEEKEEELVSGGCHLIHDSPQPWTNLFTSTTAPQMGIK